VSLIAYDFLIGLLKLWRQNLRRASETDNGRDLASEKAIDTIVSDFGANGPTRDSQERLLGCKESQKRNSVMPFSRLPAMEQTVAAVTQSVIQFWSNSEHQRRYFSG
jgi:hypothetical protein